MSTIIIEYTTDDPTIHGVISTAISSFLPYMVDNVEIHFDKEED